MCLGARNDGIPDGIDAGREALERIFHHVEHAGVVGLELVARVAQHQRSLGGRRQEFLDALETVFLQHGDLATRFELGHVGLERAGVGGVQLEQLDAVTVAALHDLLFDERRAGIDLVRSARVERLDQVDIGLQRRGQVRCVEQALHAVDGLAAGFGKFAVQSIQPGSGVRVEHGQGRLFLREILQDADQHGVLEHIGVISCVKGVAITEHRRSLRPTGPAQALRHEKPLK